MAKRHVIRRKSHKAAKKGCVSPSIGLKRNKRLKKGFRWSKSRSHCIVRAKH